MMILYGMATTKSLIDANKNELDRKWDEKYPNGRYCVQFWHHNDGLHMTTTLAKEVHRKPWKDYANRKGIVVSDDLSVWMKYHNGTLPPCYIVKNGFLVATHMNNHWKNIYYFSDKESFIKFLDIKDVAPAHINTFLELDK